MWGQSLLAAEAPKALPEGWHLRMGNAQTPEEAITDLEAFKKAAPDLASWEKRKALVSTLTDSVHSAHNFCVIAILLSTL